LGACRHLQKIIDVEYIIDMEQASENIEKGIVFKGFVKSKIMLDKKLNRWKITSLDDDEAILVMSDQSRLPIGPNEWKVPLDVCKDGKDVRRLLISSCYSNEFTCDDGICIPIQERYIFHPSILT
jgi:hypothetical protein